MSIADTLSRITQIQAQFSALASGSLPAAASAASAGGVPASAGSASGATATGSSFAGALAQAQLAQAAQSATSTSAPVDANTLPSAAAPLTTAGVGATPATFSSDLLSGQATGLAGLGLQAPSTQPTGGVALPASGAAQLTSSQQQFAQTLASDTGLDPGVVSAWLLAEESGQAAQSRQAQGNNDWLNIGYTDSGTYGSGDPVWSDPVTAANATAGWLRGQATIPGYGAASPGIQAILQTAGQPPQTQIAALQNSGWASSGYPDLPALYTQVAG